MTNYQSMRAEQSPEQPTPPAIRMHTISRSVAMAEKAIAINPYTAQPELAQRVMHLYRSQVPAQRAIEQAAIDSRVPEVLPDYKPTEVINLDEPVEGMDASYAALLISANQAARPAAETNHDIQEAHR